MALNNLELAKITVDTRNRDFTELLNSLYKGLWEKNLPFGHSLGGGLESYEFENIRKEVSNNFDGGLPTLSQYLNELMYLKNMSQAKISKRSGLGYNYINNLVNGVSEGSKYRLIAIALSMELDVKETAKLLDVCGYKLSDNFKDQVIITCIKLNYRSVDKVKDALLSVENANLELY